MDGKIAGGSIIPHTERESKDVVPNELTSPHLATTTNKPVGFFELDKSLLFGAVELMHHNCKFYRHA
jgi:hypothetical protein